MPNSPLASLERELRTLSHSEDAIRVVQTFSASLGKTKIRLDTFNQTNALVRRPVDPVEAAAFGFDTDEDKFVLLQGDIVTTDCAYFLGERVTGSPLYAVLNSSCDLVPNRKRYASLLRISQLRRSEALALEKLGVLLKFSRRDSMYLPSLPRDADDVVANAIQFDGVCQIESADLMLATRIASLSLVGWRIFGAITRSVYARANPREIEFRARIESEP